MASPFEDDADAYRAIVPGSSGPSPCRTASRLLTGHAAALLPSVVLPLSLVGFLWHMVLLALAPGRMALTDRGAVLALVPERTPIFELWEGLLLLVAAAVTVYAVAVALIAGVRVAAAAVVERSLSARTALGEASRSWPALGLLFVIAALTCVGTAVAVWSSTSIMAGAGLGVLFLVVVVALTLLQVGTLAMARATDTDTALLHTPGALRQRLPACVARLFVIGIVAALVVVLVLWLRRVLVVPGSDVFLLLGGALQTLLLVGAASLAVAFGAALLVAQTLGAAGEEEIRASLPVARPGRRASAVVGTLTTMIVVSLALPLTVWALPEQTPVRYTLETVAADLPNDRSSVDRRIDLRTVDDGHVVTVGGAENSTDHRDTGPVFHCAPECEVVVEAKGGSDATDHHVAGLGTGTRVLWDRAEDGVELTAYEGCEAGDCAGDAHVLRAEEFRPIGGYSYHRIALRSAVVEHEGRVHVFSLAYFDEEGESPEAEVQVHVCDEDGCANAQTHVLGTVPGQREDPSITSTPFLDGAVGPDGAPVASVYDPHDGAVRVLACPDSGCGAPESHTVAAAVTTPTSDFAAARDAESQVHGARVEVRPDGTPVVAYRALEDGSSRLVDCSDPLCAESVEQTLTGPDWRQHAPALALDSAGVPHLALSDRTTRTPTLLACADSGCSDWETVALHSIPELWSDVGLVLDGNDHPVLAALVRTSWAHLQDGEEPGHSLAVHHCTLPSCGLRS